MSGARDETVADAPPIMGNVPGSYALSVFRERHPVLVRQVARALPYPPDRRRALDRLLDEVVDDIMEPLEPSAYDGAAWAEWGRGKIGGRYVDVPFLWGRATSTASCLRPPDTSATARGAGSIRSAP
ncbi:hypothetical protein GCM10027612_25790 [Microbispora bryophytorum subsp. camponoti]